MLRYLSHVAVLLTLSASLAVAAEKPAGLDKQGKPDIKSAGALAFGPPGVLFVGDTQGAALFAIGVDAGAGKHAASVRVEGVDAKLAAAVGAKAADVAINDIAVQPRTGVVFLSASRGRGPDAAAVLASIDGAGTLTVLPLDNVAWSKIALTNVPSAEDKNRSGASMRQDAITDINYVDGTVFVAGLSNEAFDSRLRGIEFPFSASSPGTTVEIFHGAHGRVESTAAPVRTFVPFAVNGEPHLLAAYTCTPLVSIPLSQLKNGSKVRGKTVAELGNRNKPLDIIAYEKDGHQYLLLANSARGVMKIKVEGIEDQEAIEKRIDGTAGLPYETIKTLEGVEQLDKLDGGHAVILVKKGDTRNLETISLP